MTTGYEQGLLDAAQLLLDKASWYEKQLTESVKLEQAVHLVGRPRVDVDERARVLRLLWETKAEELRQSAEALKKKTAQ